jgi:hypothetical protein
MLWARASSRWVYSAASNYITASYYYIAYSIATF